MAYDKRISRAAPGLVVSALDDSGSMAGPLPGTSDAKYEWVERDHGHIFKELLARSTEQRGDSVVIKPRYYVYLIRYGSMPEAWAPEELDIEAAVTKYAAAGNSLGLGGHLGGTDAEAALRLAREFLKKAVACERYRNSFPPLVFHLTDGMSQSDATQVAEDIMALTTADGNVLMVNGYIGTQTSLSYTGPEDFPGYVTEKEAGPSEDNLRLFRMSSLMPECIRQNLVDDGIFPAIREGARLFFDVRTKEMLKHTIQVVGSMGSRADRTRT